MIGSLNRWTSKFSVHADPASDREFCVGQSHALFTRLGIRVTWRLFYHQLKTQSYSDDHAATMVSLCNKR